MTIIFHQVVTLSWLLELLWLRKNALCRNQTVFSSFALDLVINCQSTVISGVNNTILTMITHFNRLYFSTQKEAYALYGVLNSYLPITKLLITRHGVRIREGIVWFSNTHLMFIIKQKIAIFKNVLLEFLTTDRSTFLRCSILDGSYPGIFFKLLLRRLEMISSMKRTLRLKQRTKIWNIFLPFTKEAQKALTTVKYSQTTL